MITIEAQVRSQKMPKGNKDKYVWNYKNSKRRNEPSRSRKLINVYL